MKFIKKYYLEIIFVIPLTLYIFSFTLLPIFETILMGFQDYYTGEWTIATYLELFNKRDFSQAVFNTIAITFIEILIQIPIGLLIAMFLKQRFKGVGIVRSLVLMPMGIPTLVSGVAMLYIFGTQGYLNSFLYKIGLIDVPINWTSGGIRSLFVVAIADCWKVLPIVVLLLLAGLESISSDFYEASSIDGATKWQQFKYITLPLLKPSITMTVILRAVEAFRIFELPQVLVGKTLPVLSTYAYEEYAYNNLNASAVASTTLLIIIVIFVLLYLKFVDRGEAMK